MNCEEPQCTRAQEHNAGTMEDIHQFAWAKDQLTDAAVSEMSEKTLRKSACPVNLLGN